MRKVISFVIVVCFCVCLSATAFASTVSWSSGQYDYRLTFTPNASGYATRNVVIPQCIEASHVYGTDSSVYYYGTYDVISEAEHNCSWTVQMRQAINAQSGYAYSKTFSGEATQPVLVPSYASSGKYKVAVIIEGDTGSWQLVKTTDDLGVLTASVSPATYETTNGTVSYLPMYNTDALTYKRVSS